MYWDKPKAPPPKKNQQQTLHIYIIYITVYTKTMINVLLPGIFPLDSCFSYSWSFTHSTHSRLFLNCDLVKKKKNSQYVSVSTDTNHLYHDTFLSHITQQPLIQLSIFVALM